MKKWITEYSHYLSHSREDTNLLKSHSNLGSPKPEVSLYNNFDHSYLARPNFNDDMPLSSLEQRSDLLTFLSQDLAPHASSPKDITDDILISFVPATTLMTFVSFKRVKTLIVLVS